MKSVRDRMASVGGPLRAAAGRKLLGGRGAHRLGRGAAAGAPIWGPLATCLTTMLTLFIAMVLLAAHRPSRWAPGAPKGLPPSDINLKKKNYVFIQKCINKMCFYRIEKIDIEFILE